MIDKTWISSYSPTQEKSLFHCSRPKDTYVMAVYIEMIAHNLSFQRRKLAHHWIPEPNGLIVFGNYMYAAIL